MELVAVGSREYWLKLYVGRGRLSTSPVLVVHPRFRARFETARLGFDHPGRAAGFDGRPPGAARAGIPKIGDALLILVAELLLELAARAGIPKIGDAPYAGWLFANRSFCPRKTAVFEQNLVHCKVNYLQKLHPHPRPEAVAFQVRSPKLGRELLTRQRSVGPPPVGLRLGGAKVQKTYFTQNLV